MGTEKTTEATNELKDKIWKALEEVPDPEIPAISVVDLGIISGVSLAEDGTVQVTMTPTFSGCPAIDLMRKDIEEKLADKLPGMSVAVKVDMETQWTTNKITDKGREALKNFGLAPPKKYVGSFSEKDVMHVNCPHCDSENTTMNSSFGPTLCRAIHYCFDCLQGFEQFKPL